MGQYSCVTESICCKTILDALSLHFAALRCLTGLLTTASLGEQTKKAGNMQLISQRMLLQSYPSFMWFFCLIIPQHLDSCPSPPCLSRSYHGYKTMKDFVRRRRWARYYLKKGKKYTDFSAEKLQSHTHTLTLSPQSLISSHIFNSVKRSGFYEGINPLKSSIQPACVLCLVL